MSREEFGGSVRRPSGRSRAQSSTEPHAGGTTAQCVERAPADGPGSCSSPPPPFWSCCAWEELFIACANFTGEGSSDPTTIEAVRHEMAELNLPAGYLPAVYGRLGEFRGVAYVNPETDGRIQLFEVATNMHDAKMATQQSLAGQPAHPQPTTEPLLNVKSHMKQIRVKGKECHSSSAKGSIPRLATRAGASRVPSREKVDRRQSKSTWMRLHITKAKLSQCSKEFGKELRGARTAPSGGN